MIEINVLPEEHRPKKRPAEEEKGVNKTLLTVAVAGALGLGTLVDNVYNQGWLTRRTASAIGMRDLKKSVENPTRFPYSFSPWEEYARLEEAILRELEIPESVVAPQTERVLAAGRNITDRVATRILRARNTCDIAEAMKTIPRDWLMKEIAYEIADEGIFYSEESLLSESFDPKLHEPGRATLDCDLLTNLMGHVLRNLDVETYFVPGPAHLYFTVESGDGETVFVMEPTKFRKVIVRGNSINMAGNGIDDGFFSDWETQKKHGGLVAHPKYAERVGLHKEIVDEQFLRESMLSNILAGVSRKVKDKDQKEKLYEMAWQLAQDAVNYNLAKNTYTFCVEAGESAVKDGEYQKAMTAFQRAAGLRKKQDLYTEPSELTLMGKLLYETGDLKAASQVLSEAREFYEKHEDGPILWIRGKPLAWNEEHAILLTYSALIEGRKDQAPANIYERWIVPAYNQLGQNERTRASPEFQKLSKIVDRMEAKRR